MKELNYFQIGWQILSMSKEDTKCFGKLKKGRPTVRFTCKYKNTNFLHRKLISILTRFLMFFVIKVICTATCKSVVRLLLDEFKRLFLVVPRYVKVVLFLVHLGTVSHGPLPRKPGGGLGGLPAARVGSTCQPPNYIPNNRLLSAELWTSQITPLRATTL